MNRGLSYIVVFLFAMQIVFAGITIDGLERTEYNLGDKINIKGKISYDETVIGALKIDLVCGDTSLPVYFSLVDINAGKSFEFNQDIPTRVSLLGDCKFVVTVEGAVDDYEKESGNFKVSDELKVDVNVNVLVVDPGSEVVITGTAYRLNGEIVENGKASIEVDKDKKELNLENGLFEYNLGVSSTAKSGKHEIIFKVEDLIGNKGEDTTNFKVRAIPKWVELIVDESYKPGAVINGKALLHDQANDLIDEDAIVEIYNSESKLEYTKTVGTSDAFGIELGEFEKPGTWRVKVKTAELTSEKSFAVSEVKSKEMWIEGGMLYVRNTGNVDYTDPVQITLEGDSEVSFIKTTSIKPNQTIEVDLNNEVDYSGEYGLSVEGYPSITGNVVLEGKKAFGGSGLGWIALTFVFIFFIYVVYKRGRRFVGKKGKSIKDIRAKGKGILERTGTKEDETKQKDINYLVNKVKKENPINTNKNNSDDSNMFRIFDN